jgi:hypothetical protein
MEILEMKLFTNSLRVWISLASIGGFLAGWSLFAHSQKPVAANSQAAANPAQTSVQLAPLPTLEPLPEFGQTASNFQAAPSVSQNFGFSPRLRTGGS